MVTADCAIPQPTTRPAAKRGVANRPTTAPADGGPDAAGMNPEALPGRTHIVRAGDTLWNLAERYYGHGKHMHKIHAANRKRLKDPNELPAGMKLIIP